MKVVWTHKTCAKCRHTLPAAEFYVDKGHSSGVGSYCKKCKRIQQNEWKRKNPDKVLANHLRYWDKNRDRCVAVRNKWRENNRDKEREYARLYREKYPERVSASSKKYKKAHPERVREYNNKWSARNRRKRSESVLRSLARKLRGYVEDIDRRKLWERDGGVCYLCVANVDFENMHVDHVIPLSRGGEHSYANCKTACGSCNHRKSNKTLGELRDGSL